MSDLNDPRVLFAAERTLLAWNRTSVSLMALGFVVERFGLFLELSGRQDAELFQRHISFFVGVSFILLASFISLFSSWQHWKILRSIRPVEIPSGYKTGVGMFINVILSLLGLALSIYLARGFV